MTILTRSIVTEALRPQLFLLICIGLYSKGGEIEKKKETKNFWEDCAIYDIDIDPSLIVMVLCEKIFWDCDYASELETKTGIPPN